MTDQKLRLTVYRGWDTPGEYVWSPLVTKLEARLRFASVGYKADCGSVRKSPTRKIPYIEFPNRELVSDTALIGKRLVNERILEDLNEGLSPLDKVHDLGVRSLLEDKWYFLPGGLVRNEMRITTPCATMFLWGTPMPLRILVGFLVHRNISATLYGQGAACYTIEEKLDFGIEIWKGIEALLLESKRKQGGGEEPFWVLGNEKPSEADTTLFGMISGQMSAWPAAPRAKKVVASFPIVMEYAKRIHGR